MYWRCNVWLFDIIIILLTNNDFFMMMIIRMISYCPQLVSESVTEEVCETETYIASCETSSVIAVMTAHYGRKALGRCVTRDYGYVGCYADVLSWTSGRCDNQNSCELSPSDPELQDYRHCPRDLSSYLEITYTCVAGNSTTMLNKYAKIPWMKIKKIKRTYSGKVVIMW